MVPQVKTGDQTGSQNQAEDQKSGAPVTSQSSPLVVRRRHAARWPVDIPKPKGPFPGTPAGAEALALAEAERDRQLAIKYAGTTPHGRQIIRMRIYALQKALRQAEGSVIEEWAAIRKLFPEPMFTALSLPQAGRLPQDLGEQMASHLNNTAQTTVYLAAVERLSAAYEELKQMPHYQDKAPWVIFYRALAARLRPPAGEASPRPEPDRAGELAGALDHRGAG